MRYKIIQQFNQSVRKYQQYPHGVNVIREFEADDHIYALMELSNYFRTTHEFEVDCFDDEEKNDGTLIRANGDELYDPNYPDVYDCGDYQYKLVEADDE